MDERKKKVVTWSTPKDEVITLSEYLAGVELGKSGITIIGSQDGDFSGASALFHVTMDRAIAEKFFGESRVISSEFYYDNNPSHRNRARIFV